MDDDILRKQVLAFVDSVQGAFTLEHIIDDLNKHHQEVEDNELWEEVFKICAGNKRLNLVHYHGENNHHRFIKHPDLFNGSQFCVKPTKFEIQNNILIPGHRFMPFCSPGVASHAVRITTEGSEWEKNHFALSYRQSFIYHSLFGRLGMIGILSSESDSNVLAIEEFGEDAELQITAFDMAAFYEKHNFTYGDMIILTVEDWLNGICSFSKVLTSADQKHEFASLSEYLSEFDAALDYTCEYFGASTIAEQQLCRIFAHAGAKLLQNPIIHIGGALEMSNKFTIKELAGSSILWNKDQDPEEMLDLADFSHLPYDGAEAHPIDQIMTMCGIPYTSREIEGFVRNEFYHGNNTDNHIYKTVFEEFKGDFSPEQQQEISDFVDEVWATITTTYNRFADNNDGKLREELIKIKRELVTWLIKLEKQVNDLHSLPTKKVLQFSEVMSYVSQSIELCNNNDEVMSTDQLDHNLERLDDLRFHADYLMNDIMNDIRE